MGEEKIGKRKLLYFKQETKKFLIIFILIVIINFAFIKDKEEIFKI